ncbi:DUF6402 family protein [Ralstonia sp. ASV6]|uniref:DUF6402 family protein n=1 Tax=Ralstonia sp. ASV6 TaxID=2795124 RepID=UPI0018EB406E|nr:DUF6402 family protein [Ralstonia sp. ASV6]
MNPLATTRLAPEDNYQPTRHSLKPLQLSEIPGAMDRMGWPIAARLMRRWFSNKNSVMIENVRNGRISPLTLSPREYDDKIVKLDWALRYPRCAEAYDRLLANWASPKGVEALKIQLTKQGWHQGKQSPVRLGYAPYTGHPLVTARELHATCQMNLSIFGKRDDTLDDMYGALGVAVCYAAVVGYTGQSASGRDIFVVDQLGCYIRDTYDFNDGGFTPEPLGVWSRDRCLTKAETVEYFALLSGAGRDSLFAQHSELAARYPGFVPVFNGDFRRWREAHNSGGDFLVFSDVRWHQPIAREIQL